MADRQLVVPGCIGLEIVQAQRRAGCPVDHRLAQAPFVCQRGEDGRRDGQLDRLPLRTRKPSRRAPSPWWPASTAMVQGVARVTVASRFESHDMIISRRINTLPWPSAVCCRLRPVNRQVLVIPLITDWLSSNHGGNQIDVASRQKQNRSGSIHRLTDSSPAPPPPSQTNPARLRLTTHSTA